MTESRLGDSNRDALQLFLRARLRQEIGDGNIDIKPAPNGEGYQIHIRTSDVLMEVPDETPEDFFERIEEISRKRLAS